MKKICAIAACACGLWAAPAGEPPALHGYSREGSRTHREWEAKFRAIPSPKLMREYMQRLAAHPHHVGSPIDRENAEWLLARFREWGFEAQIETFRVLFPTPRERLLEMVAPSRFTARLTERAAAGDATSAQASEQLPTYNAYSADGDVTAPLVYVNYGIPEDYEILARMGITVKGAIVIARYGASWRGTKPKVAAEHGAVGCIIYSDPRDDGYFQGEVFPKGPYRPRDGAQRGSVVDMPVYPGDPLTPGVGATADAKRLPLAQAETLMKIPVLPVSYGDAQPLLQALGGPVAPQAWRGALPITYHVGPGPAKVHLKLKFSWDLKPIYNVVARMAGSTWPDEWVLRGNHHDAWVNGADDPVAGAVALMEEARAFAELARQGWRPKRTLVYCLWDGEEPGLLGSTEWAEQHAAELRQHAVAYINSDSNGRGYLQMGGSQTLEEFINGVARDIQDPEKGISVWKRLQLHRIASAAQREEARQRTDLRLGAVGSGSDYTVFLDHVGVPVLNLGYGGEDGSGIYHSIYDDLYFYSHFSDAELAYGRTLAQTAGTAVMRLAGAEWLPFDFTALAGALDGYVAELQRLLAGKREEIAEQNREISEGVFSAISDPKYPLAPPKTAELPPALDFAPLCDAVADLGRSAQRYGRVLAAARKKGLRASPAVNAILRGSERALMLPDGLPGRPWFLHQVYAPGLYTGYGVKTIPGVREAIEQSRWQEAEVQIARAAQAIRQEIALVDRVAVELEK
ncbi:MAG: M28 family peptidase [Acidobacteria bacterium]|nr:M28 family peptidase [Acidobacteriota bacterium]